MKELLINIFYRSGALFASLKQSPHTAIIMYHRILPEQENITESASLSISTDLFEQHLQFFSNNYHVITLDQFLEEPQSIENRVILTFDDGYKDNLKYALPLLEKYHLPATIYITTSFPEQDCNLWWYDLAEITNQKKLFDFTFQNKHYYFDNLHNYSPALCYKYFHQFLITHSPLWQKEFMHHVEPNFTSTSKNFVLNWNEIQKLDNHPLITIGAHTHSHGILATQTYENAKLDILKSKQLLEENLHHNIDHFCYPVGTLHDAANREYKLIQELGFKTGVTTIYNNNIINSSQYSLPRIATKKRTKIFHLKAKLAGWNHFFKGVQI